MLFTISNKRCLRVILVIIISSSCLRGEKAQAAKAYERQQQEIERMEDFIQRNKARVATRGMANSRAKRLEKMEILEKPKSILNLALVLKKAVHQVALS